MIRAIIFDFGKVLYRFNNELLLRRFAEHSAQDIGQLREVLFASGLSRELECGRISPEQFFETVTREGRLTLSKNDFFGIYTEKLTTPILSSSALVRQLKSHGYRVSLLSNTNAIDFERVIKKMDIFGLFDSVTVSFAVGHMKPDVEIYHDALAKLGLRPDECVFIDDLADNALGAARLGMHAIHYTSHRQLVRELQRLGIRI